MRTYIRSAGNISPQHSLDGDAFFKTKVSTTQNYFKAKEPDYDVFIDSKMIRRMSRIVKMGVAAALTCLKNAGIDNPAAIITATAYGCLEDTSSFLRRMIEFEEKMLSPTSFIQSTHNTVGAQIALLLKCHNYNNTIVHRSFSFENALIEANLLLAEGRGPVLAGAVDEITADSHTILSRFGLYKTTDNHNGVNCYNINGEGASFFLLDNNPGHNPEALIRDLSTIYMPANDEEIRIAVVNLLNRNNLMTNQIDLVLSSHTGQTKKDKTDNYVLDSLFPDKPFFPFKSLCGDYPTASGFALWMAARLLKEQKQPEWMNSLRFPLNNILIYHRSGVNHHSIYLIGKC
jgi:3-oxoacyl-[acyl-carrier-protein] synthase II